MRFTVKQLDRYMRNSNDLKSLFETYRNPSAAKESIYAKCIEKMFDVVEAQRRLWEDTDKKHVETILDYGIICNNTMRFTFAFWTYDGYGQEWLRVITDCNRPAEMIYYRPHVENK